MPEADRARLEAACKKLEADVESLRPRLTPTGVDLLPDAEIYIKAVRFALDNGEFFDKKEIAQADALLQEANERLAALLAIKWGWPTAKGPVVRGFRSKLDGSVQPYGVVIPEKLDLSKPAPVVVWLHGRGDKVGEIKFIQDRSKSAGQVAPPWAITVHPYGRYCNGFKSAGEVDVLEVLADVQRRYKVDPDRVVLWGFSMGGAGAWHLGAHFADQWAAVAPGAGFAETARYVKLKPENFPPKYEQTLWGLYDVPNYARNLLNTPLVAYSGELDKQKQAADVMAEALADHGHELKHLIGPGVEHKYHPETLKELTALIEGYAKQGRSAWPKTVTLQTRTLRYHKLFWVDVQGLDAHWEDARVDAHLLGDDQLSVATRNVNALRLTWPGEKAVAGRKIEIDGQPIAVAADAEAHVTTTLEKQNGHWKATADLHAGPGLSKRPGLQGPIDDVFMEPFLVVAPGGKCRHEGVQAWTQGELAHLQDRWRRLFRAELPVKRDVEVTAEDLRTKHLILFGDERSNALIAKVLKDCPIAASSESIRLSGKTYDPATHVLSAVFPNPLHPTAGRYVALNSGLTFREAHDRTNSQQNPKLPDWALIDVTVPASDVSPGKVVAAGFFDESWKLPAGE